MMFKYFPHTEADIQEMLKDVGLSSCRIFAELPKEVLLQGEVDLPEAHSEIELRKNKGTGRKNKRLFASAARVPTMSTPAVIPAILSRQEFHLLHALPTGSLAETLQYIFEFQSLIANSPASTSATLPSMTGDGDDGSALHGRCADKKKQSPVSSALNPRVSEVLKTYARYRNIELVFIENEDFRTSEVPACEAR